MEHYDIFISYRRKGAKHLAMFIKRELIDRGYSVFLDLDSMRSGNFDEQIYRKIEDCTDMVVLLPPQAMDRCFKEGDWLRLEIAHALQCGKNIIPVMMDGFSFPKKLPADIAVIQRKQGFKEDSALMENILRYLQTPRPPLICPLCGQETPADYAAESNICTCCEKAFITAHAQKPKARSAVTPVSPKLSPVPPAEELAVEANREEHGDTVSEMSSDISDTEIVTAPDLVPFTNKEEVITPSNPDLTNMTSSSDDSVSTQKTHLQQASLNVPSRKSKPHSKNRNKAKQKPKHKPAAPAMIAPRSNPKTDPERMTTKKRGMKTVVIIAVIMLSILGILIYNYWKAEKLRTAEEQYALGEAYYYGRDVEQSFEKAIICYQTAAKHNYAPAQYALGDCYYLGKGVVQNYETAIEWYRKAASQGYAEAEWSIGLCYSEGNGVEQDYELATQWYQRAADHNSANGQCSLGVICFNKGHYGEAVSWYQKAGAQGLASAQKHLGFCYEHGAGVEQNYKTAFEWYQKAADQNHAEAQYCVGHCYHYGYGVERNLKKAAEYYQMAAKQGNSDAEKALKALSDAGMIIPDPDESQ